MLSFSGSLRILIALEPCDMRAGFDRLQGLVAEKLKEDVKSGALFVFSNRRRRRLSFSIPIWHGDHRIPVASFARAATGRGSTKGAKRRRDG